MNSATLEDAPFHKAKACGTAPHRTAAQGAISSSIANLIEEGNITSQKELGRFCSQGPNRCLLQVHVAGLCFVDNERIKKTESFFRVKLMREI